jgi:hypothetical protein
MERTTDMGALDVFDSQLASWFRNALSNRSPARWRGFTMRRDTISSAGTSPDAANFWSLPEGWPGNRETAMDNAGARTAMAALARNIFRIVLEFISAIPE